MSNIGRQRGRRSRRARLSRRMRETLSLLAAVAAVLAAVWIVLRIFTGVSGVTQSDTFYEGVYVNGTSMAGYTYEDGYALIERQTNERLNTAVTLTYGDKTWTVTPAMLDASMTFQTQVSYAWNYGHTGSAAERKAQIEELKNNTMQFDSALTYDEEKLDQFIADVKAAIDVEPVEATVIVGVDEQLTVTDSRDGIRLDGDALKARIQNVIVEGGAATIALEPETWTPQQSSADLKSGTSLISSAQTSTANSSGQRNKNIRRALKPFDGYELKPGEQLNFNQVVGKRTIENGFYEAVEYAGTDVVEGIGGGTCQASTTLYLACLQAGLTVIDRSPHTMRVGYTKPSLDAAVSDRGKNLIVQNDLEYPVYFYTSVDGGRAEVKIYGMPSRYTIVLENEITEDNIRATGFKSKADTAGKYVYYTTDMPVLYEEGKKGCRSKGYRLYYDAQTGELVDRQLLSTDYYYPTKDTYWVGVHTVEEELLG